MAVLQQFQMSSYNAEKDHAASLTLGGGHGHGGSKGGISSDVYHPAAIGLAYTEMFDLLTPDGALTGVSKPRKLVGYFRHSLASLITPPLHYIMMNDTGAS
jgi:hypothetical protein